MTIKTDGIIIREGATGEQDRIVTVLTRQAGVIKAFANGARNPKNKNVSSTGLLCYCDFLITKTKKGVYIIREAVAKEVFFSLRSDIVKLSLAQYFAELTYELSPREEDSSEFLSLLLNSVYMLTTDKKELLLIKAVFEMRMVSLAGYMPDIFSCRSCEKTDSDTMYFDVAVSEIYCSDCPAPQRAVEMPLSAVAAMRHICLCDKARIFSFSLPRQAREALSTASEKYIRSITSRKYKTLDFFNMMYEG